MKRVLAGLRRELDEDLGAIEGLAPVRERGPEIAELTADLDAQLERVQGVAVITLVGSTGAGKSTLLNALVGKTIAREGETRPTTAAPVIYRPRDADLSDLVEGLPGDPPEVVDYDPAGGGPWSEQILIDAPDTNSVAAFHREVVQALAARSDVLLVVAHRQSVAELASVEFVEPYAERRGLLLVLNRADELTDEARDELLSQLRTVASERFGAPEAPVLAVSARLARSEPDPDGWTELCDELQGLVRSGRLSRVRRHNALGTAAALARVGGELQGEVGPALEELESEVIEGLERWRELVDTEVGERFELRRAGLKGQLWNEVARHWDGPGGWALRAGGLSTLGLGAGAALARRNPVLAAGAAVGALAADKTRAVVQRRSFSETSGLLPGTGELETWYREALGPARLTAARLSGEPESLGVPSGEDLAQSASQAVGGAWDRLVDRDLLDAAARAAQWYVRWPVDAPVYALAAWVVYKAIVGFFSGAYVGFDFLINAGLILGAWLFVARTFVRFLLGGKSTALLGAARSRAGTALDAAGETHGRDVREEVDRRRRALKRLAGLETRWRERVASE